MKLSNQKNAIEPGLIVLLNKPAGVVIFPKQGIAKSRIVDSIEKFMKGGWEVLSAKEREIVREVVRDNPRFFFGKEVPQND
ncbi:MAG TPA: hypothetical protein VGQ59_05820 [Cyclobacteriaceae bacterium]|jgi:hypothetical protein|nr:hypothetical protein [Cyclobacteriaceae bacterium]